MPQWSSKYKKSPGKNAVGGSVGVSPQAGLWKEAGLRRENPSAEEGSVAPGSLKLGLCTEGHAPTGSQCLSLLTAG